jgi:hypothetical protein
LLLVRWFLHRHKKSELSTDALIKFFAAGFCLSTSLAVFWEIVCSLVLKVFITLVLLMAGVGEEGDPESNRSPSDWVKTLGFGADQLVPDGRLRLASSGLKDFLQAFGNDHPVFYTLYILVTAFFLAAFIEELCKYFGYRMVEHPDFMSAKELNEASQIVLGENSHHGHDDEEANNYNAIVERTGFAKQGQSRRAQGANIMLAMIAVAIGFACCENLVYLFIYSKGSIQMQLTVLISRSLFPVHPIAATLQSIGVCRRDVEGERHFQLGRIILPAVLFHGGYDFFILWIDFLSRRHGTYAKNDDDGGGAATASDDANLAAVATSFVVSMLCLVIALVYVVRASRLQRERLANMDRGVAVDHSRLL